MDLITTENQLNKNLRTIDHYLSGSKQSFHDYAIARIKRGTCFVVEKVGNEYRFYPSRFIGYKNNSIRNHSINDSKDGRETNKAISDLLGSRPQPNNVLNDLYITYCSRLGFTSPISGSFGARRKFWLISTLDFDIEDAESDDDEFPEGGFIKKTHLARERDPKVVAAAKKKFKAKNGKLYCEVCEFDFEKNYGSIGKDFIEAHHTIPVSMMSRNHKTKASDLAMVCSNCHRMLHRKRPWLSINELKLILRD